MHDKKGFTLVELMVSLALFTIVVLASISALYTVNDASRKVQAMRSTLDNLNFAIESMSRTIRTGSGIVCVGGAGNNCPFSTGYYSPKSDLIVQSTLGQNTQVEYRCSGCGGSSGQIQKKTGSGSWVAITSPEINVQSLSFYVSGVGADALQPSVIMFVKGVATAGGTTAPFAVQTYISQRAIE